MVTLDVSTRAADVRLVALDIDGTLLEPDKTIAPELRQSLRELRGRGVELTTASGRPVDFQIELLQRYNLTELFSALITDERELYLAEGSSFVPYEEWNQKVRRRWAELFNRGSRRAPCANGSPRNWPTNPTCSATRTYNYCRSSMR
jgi:hypothetical protein